MVRVLARTSWRARAPRRPLATGVAANVAVDGAAKTALFSFEISTVHPRCNVFHPRSPSSWVINGRLERKNRVTEIGLDPNVFFARTGV